MRGKRFRTKELAEGVRVPYDLHWSERGVPISDLIGNVLDRMIPGITNMSGEAMRDFLRGWEVDGRPMHEWGFWNLLARGMSHEAYELARVTGGYDTAAAELERVRHHQPQLRPRRASRSIALRAAISRCRSRWPSSSSRRAGRSTSARRAGALRTVDADGMVALAIEDAAEDASRSGARARVWRCRGARSS